MMLTKKRVKRNQRKPNSSLLEGRDQTRTLGEHLAELQNRFLSIAVLFLLFSVLAYPFFDTIVGFLLAPLGEDHKLVYLTPGGAFGFIIQACMSIGFVLVLPVAIYNLYRFIMPVVSRTTIRRAIGFTLASFILAMAGIAFAYYISLPAALYFLTGFELHHIDPMLTIDSYFSFITMYMLVGAALFQIPLLMLLINGYTPLGPKKLMKHQDKIILGSFIIAAIISPTPDVINQTLLASPIIVMYQVGIILVWLSNRKKISKKTHQNRSLEDAIVPISLKDSPLSPTPSFTPKTTKERGVNTTVKATLLNQQSQPTTPRVHKTTIDGFRSSARSPSLTRTSISKPRGQVQSDRRSIDGFRPKSSPQAL